jgi:hypothetical protein
LLFLHAPLSADMCVMPAFNIAEIAKGLFGYAEQITAGAGALTKWRAADCSKNV